MVLGSDGRHQPFADHMPASDPLDLRVDACLQERTDALARHLPEIAPRREISAPLVNHRAGTAAHMKWIAPPATDNNDGALEKRLWSAADQLRANSGLTAQQYSAPVLGLIFLRFAEARFDKRRAELEKAAVSARRGSRVEDPTAYHAESVLYLSEKARFASLLSLPERANVGKAVNDAMTDIEKHNPQLAGVLPRSYQLFSSTLLKDLLKKVSEIPSTVEYDAFGRIYEYFLGEFARTEGSKGGEFYTPASIVRLIVEILEPYHGRVLDPACGSGGMFVQSAAFMNAHRSKAHDVLRIHGVEKTDETGRLCRMNLAVHGLEGDIRHGGQINSYYDDPHEATGKFDFVLANPPFNVNAVDKERLESMVGTGRRFPFGLPRSDNANYLWIQLFYSSLNAKGRAGFVMANSASDARSSEQDIRRQLVEANAVDVIVAVGPNMFYTVTLSCTLWFLDRGRSRSSRQDSVLFVDARHIYRQIDRAHREWTSAHIDFLGNLARLYRREKLDFRIGGDEAAEKFANTFGKKARYVDVPGLCRAASLAEIEAQGWSLTPGRYVGVAPGDDMGDEDFNEQFGVLNEELMALTTRAHELEDTIARNVAAILGL